LERTSLNKISSGIEGLDKIIGGGIPKKDTILLSGECGAGKSIFGMQFLTKSHDSGVYVSFEDEVEKIMDNAAVFGWDLLALQKEDKLRVLRYDPFKLEDIIEVIESEIREIKATRVVLDSVSALGIYMKDVSDLRRMILQVDTVLRKNGCTSLVISEIVPGKPGISRFGVEEFVTDGVIVMRRYLSQETYKRGLTVLKMRGSEHSQSIHDYEITKNGITVGGKIKLA
jgi:KaiC/GvpD/RAD55 family RecA-like ATPase